MQTKARLTDVAKGCVQRMVNSRRGGCREQSAYKHFSVAEEREWAHHDWVTESKRETQGVFSPTTNRVSTLLSNLHCISLAAMSLIQSICICFWDNPWQFVFFFCFFFWLNRPCKAGKVNPAYRTWAPSLRNGVGVVKVGLATFQSTFLWTNSSWALTFLWKVWAALKQKMTFATIVWQRNGVGKLWAYFMEAFMFCFLRLWGEGVHLGPPGFLCGVN